MRRWAAVCGTPIAHSLSPVLHRAAYRTLGLDWSYEARECGADGLPAQLAHARNDPAWAGFSLTMPLKTAVLPLLDEVDALAVAVGAVNTVVPAADAGGSGFGGVGAQTRPDARPGPPALSPSADAGPVPPALSPSADGLPPGRLAGFNTDVAGMQAALAEAGVREPGRTLILGGGGTAQAALAALAQLGQRQPVVAVRDRARAIPLLEAAQRLGTGPEVVAWPALDVLLRADLVISTVPAGAADVLARHLAGPPGTAERAAMADPRGGSGGVAGPGGWPARTCLFEVVYAPWPTDLATVAMASGAPVIGGLELLVQQAVRQVELMTGRTVATSVLRAAGQQAIRQR
ncbi:MAG: shikimate dehydrogenase family protein [Frankiaceae bacterium]